MKEYKRIKGSKLQKELIEIIDQHETFKKSYFWSSPSNSSARRAYEKKYSRIPVAFIYDSKKYEIEQTVNCSCKNVYYNFSVYVDSEKKNITAIKKLLK